MTGTRPSGRRASRCSAGPPPPSRPSHWRRASAAGVKPEDLAAIVPHQANLRIIDAIARKVKATNAVVADDIVHSGNTSGASIPLAMSRMIERGDVPSGAPALLVGFGAGLSYAAQVIQIP